jgi:diaminopimelate epimerase
MEGAGNDYIYVDAFRDPLSDERAAELAPALSDRHFGIGADGLILLAPSAVADCRMRMWNADGSRGSMCGNGLRCLAKLAVELGHVRGPHVAVECDERVVRVELIADSNGEVHAARVAMGLVEVDATPHRSTFAGHDCTYYLGNAGNPHAVVFLPHSPDAAPLEAVGAAFQRDARFPGGINVELVQVLPDGDLMQRTYERGSGETLACGSGASVAALAAVRTGRVRGPRVGVHLRGGTLVVTTTDTGLVLEGPARTVFRGEIFLPSANPPA